jgi:hypothetical protein
VEQCGQWCWGFGRLQCGGRAQGGLQGPIKEEAGGLGVRAPVGIAAMIRAGKADHATTRRDPGSGKEASGGRARTGDWPMGSCSGAGWSGSRAATARRGGTEGAGTGKKERKAMVTDRWGRAEGMTEKEGND